MITDDIAREHIAANVVRILHEQGKSRYWLAQQTGEWQSRIASVCKGTRLCSAAMLARIATALNVSVDDLVSIPRKNKKDRVSA